jgi:uncharacterized protein YwgA
MNMADMEVISLPKEVLERLKVIKRDNESLLAAVIRLINTNFEKLSRLKKFEGILDEDDDEIWEETEKMIYENRSHSRS